MIDVNRRPEALRAALLMAAAAASFAVMFSFAVTRAFAAEDAGQLAFNNACRTCHSMDAGDNRLGPTLHNIVGGKAGSSEGYKYSPALKNAELTWDEATLDKFIAAPDSVVSGNNMKPYTGISDKTERDKIIGYLKTAQGDKAASE